MKSIQPYLIFICLFFLLQGSIRAQEWNFIKEKDGIKIYTRSEEGNPVKSFRGEMELEVTLEQASRVIGRIESFDWWEEDITEIRVLDYKEEKYIKYYLVYDVPWPLSDRDLCVEAIITNDSVTHTRTVFAKPIPGLIPIYSDKVRITNYWQKWVMQQVDASHVHLTLEGTVDPGGAIPNWLINMVITDTPYNVMKKASEVMVSKK